jgi:hypothetical protein
LDNIIEFTQKPPHPTGTPPKEGKCKKIIAYKGKPEEIVKK